jgi:glycine hydroxymethyltransferase
MDAHRTALAATDPEVFRHLAGEEARQKRGIELIPSENYTYPEVLAALGSVFTNKYAEGYPGRRYYGGQDFTDRVERLACERAREVFGCEHANVQPLSGSPMNQAAYLGLLEPGDPILAMDLSHGGHLTHGSPVSHMGRLFQFIRYQTRTDEQGRVDFDELSRLARKARPKLVLCGTTSSPRLDDYASFRRVADEVGALTMADVSHIGGLIAGRALPNPFEAGIDVVTTTSHKSLRGPRGGILMCRRALAKKLDASVFPGLQGGPHMHTITGIAVTLGKALQEDFREYARAVLRNAQALAETLLAEGVSLITGGTDNHLMVVDTVESFGLDGRRAEQTLDAVSITTNKQIVPDEPRPAMRPSGIRLGTPAATTRGMGTDDMARLGAWIAGALRHADDSARLASLRAEVESHCGRFPVPGLESR